MIRSKAPRALAVATAAALVIAACGSDDDTTDDTTDDTESVDDAPEATEAPDGEVTEETPDDGTEAPTTEGEGSTDTESTGDGFSYGIVEPAFIDSYNVQESEGFEVARLLYDGLTDLNSDLEAIPAVAESWDSPDNTVWTFNLRDDVTFHDGTPVTADAFVRAFNYVANPDNLSDVAYYGSAITGIAGWGDVETGDATEVSGVNAIDDTTLEITLASPYPLLPKAMSHPVFSPRAEGDIDGDAPIGNGPYMMDGSWEHDVEINLARFEGYYDEPGKSGSIQFRILQSVETMYLEVEAGGLDIADVPPEQIDSARSAYGDRFIELDIGSYNYLGFPTGTAPYDNPDIRKALSMAIDRQAIVDAIFAGSRAPANGFAPALAPGAVGECANSTYNPEMAKELYDAAGGIDGPIEVFFNSGGGHEEWIQAVANQWQQILGVGEVTFTGQEFAPYLDVLQSDAGVTGPYRLGWLWDLPSAENFLTPLFLSTSGDNFSGYASEEFDQAIADFKNAATEEDGFPALEAAQQILCDDMPVAPMFFGTAQKVYNESVSDVVYTVFGYTELENVTVN